VHDDPEPVKYSNYNIMQLSMDGERRITAANHPQRSRTTRNSIDRPYAIKFILPRYHIIELATAIIQKNH
jgi:hypothetical protein